MARSVEDMQRQIELYLNTLSCDQQAIAVILQVLMSACCVINKTRRRSSE